LNWDQLESKWQQFALSARSRWSKLTEDDWKQVDGKREQLVVRLQERYGLLRTDAEAQADEWSKRFRGAQEHRAGGAR
jgi:uncharacterized protein YjbJ (UPF0337 family)